MRLTPDNQEHGKTMSVVGRLFKYARADEHAKDSVAKPEATIAAEDCATKYIVPVDLCNNENSITTTKRSQG